MPCEVSFDVWIECDGQQRRLGASLSAYGGSQPPFPGSVDLQPHIASIPEGAYNIPILRSNIERVRMSPHDVNRVFAGDVRFDPVGPYKR